jgi:hypothetical protein
MLLILLFCCQVAFCALVYFMWVFVLSQFPSHTRIWDFSFSWLLYYCLEIEGPSSSLVSIPSSESKAACCFRWPSQLLNSFVGQNIQVSIVYPYLFPLPHIIYRYLLDLRWFRGINVGTLSGPPNTSLPSLERDPDGAGRRQRSWSCRSGLAEMKNGKYNLTCHPLGLCSLSNAGPHSDSNAFSWSHLVLAPLVAALSFPPI